MRAFAARAISSSRRLDVNWRQVASLFVLVLGSAVMAALHEKEIALVLAGAAAGYANNSRERERDHGSPASRPQV
jgi:hypothetical protein